MKRFKNNDQIKAGNHIVSIGTINISEVALISKRTDDFVEFKNIKKGGKLAKIKKKFSANLCSGDAFFFSHMTEETTQQLIDELKK